MFQTYPNIGGSNFWPEGESRSGSCWIGTTRVCVRGSLPRTGASFWVNTTPTPPGGLWLSDKLGLWRLWPHMEASSESLRPPGECMELLRTELHWGVWQNFLHTVTTTVAKITARQRDIPATTTMLPPMGAILTVSAGMDGEGLGKTREEEGKRFWCVKWEFLIVYIVRQWFLTISGPWPHSRTTIFQRPQRHFLSRVIFSAIVCDFTDLAMT